MSKMISIFKNFKNQHKLGELLIKPYGLEV